MDTGTLVLLVTMLGGVGVTGLCVALYEASESAQRRAIARIRRVQP